MAQCSTSAVTMPHAARRKDRAGDHPGAGAWAFARAVWAELARIPDYYDEAERRCREAQIASRRRPAR
jgi:hypothetical protein